MECDDPVTLVQMLLNSKAGAVHYPGKRASMSSWPGRYQIRQPRVARGLKFGVRCLKWEVYTARRNTLTYHHLHFHRNHNPPTSQTNITNHMYNVYYILH